jgi:HEAT repeat protein
VEPPEAQLVRASFASGAEGVDVLLDALNSPDPRLRVLALRGLAHRDGDVDVRRDALEQLAHAASPAVVVYEDVVALLEDDDDLVVDAAAFALGEHLVASAVVALGRVATEHADARCRESAIAALGAIGDDRSRPIIVAALDDKPAIRRRAVVALANFEGPDIEAALERASEDRDWQVRSAVAQLRDDED